MQRYQVEDFRRENEAAAAGAIHAIGSNALPFLRKWSNYNPPTWPLQLGHQDSLRTDASNALLRIAPDLLTNTPDQ